MTLGRNVNDFNSGSTKVTDKIGSSDQVLCYIGNTNEPVYLPISVLKQQTEQQVISEDIVANGVDGNTTAKLIYGVNVVTTASGTDYAIRLPYPPIKGRTVTIINTSGVPIVIYPSIVGGSINGVVNGTATVPPDSNAYTFTCWENPLPGAWSWTPPATRQWDSGEILWTDALGTHDSPNNFTNHISFVSNLIKTQGDLSTSNYYDGANRPFIEFIQYNPPSVPLGDALFKPSTVWNQITKVKVYTNLYKSTASGFRLPSEGQIMYYEPNTFNIVGSGGGGSGEIILDTLTFTENRVAGAIPPSYNPNIANFSTWFAPNIGDPYTTYYECDANALSAYPSIYRPQIGNYFLGTQNVSPHGLVDVWWSQQIQPTIISTGIPSGQTMSYKFRMFIEYN